MVRQVSQYEPKIVEFLERHKDRLNEELPRGLWVHEYNGTPDVMLLVYTEPYLRLSFIADEGHRPSSLLKLGSAFDEWARETGVTRYTMSVDESDNHYRLMLERLGAVEVGREGGWVYYVREPAHEYNLADGLRPWTPHDWVPLRPLMRAFLKEDLAVGGDLPPVRANVEEQIRQGVQGAQMGDPCLLIQEEGAVQGFMLIRGARQGLNEPTHKTCWALGLYVAPPYRKRGLGKRLYQAALERAKLAGYTKVAAVARTKANTLLHRGLGFQPGGILVEKQLVEK